MTWPRRAVADLEYTEPKALEQLSVKDYLQHQIWHIQILALTTLVKLCGFTNPQMMTHQDFQFLCELPLDRPLTDQQATRLTAIYQNAQQWRTRL